MSYEPPIIEHLGVSVLEALKSDMKVEKKIDLLCQPNIMPEKTQRAIAWDACKTVPFAQGKTPLEVLKGLDDEIPYLAFDFLSLYLYRKGYEDALNTEHLNAIGVLYDLLPWGQLEKIQAVELVVALTDQSPVKAAEKIKRFIAMDRLKNKRGQEYINSAINTIEERGWLT